MRLEVNGVRFHLEDRRWNQLEPTLSADEMITPSPVSLTCSLDDLPAKAPYWYVLDSGNELNCEMDFYFHF